MHSTASKAGRKCSQSMPTKTSRMYLLKYAKLYAESEQKWGHFCVHKCVSFNESMSDDSPNLQRCISDLSPAGILVCQSSVKPEHLQNPESKRTHKNTRYTTHTVLYLNTPYALSLSIKCTHILNILFLINEQEDYFSVYSLELKRLF